MPDITMCNNTECAKRESCYRFTATPDYLQSYAKFEGGKECEYFWDNKKESKKDG